MSAVDLVNDDSPSEDQAPRGEVRRIMGAPALAVTLEEREMAEQFAADKLATSPYRTRMERADNYCRSLIDGTLAEFYVAKLLDLPGPDLEIHSGNHGSDVGEFQVKATDFDRWAPHRRSFVFYPEALARGTGTVLGLAYRGDLDGETPRRYRLLFAFSYEDARTLAREPFTASGRSRGARAVYVRDLDSVATPLPWETYGNIWSF